MKVTEVPVSYRRRIGKSKVSGTVRGVVGAGSKILYVIGREAMDGMRRVSRSDRDGGQRATANSRTDPS
jgi:hypothetical protein